MRVVQLVVLAVVLVQAFSKPVGSLLEHAVEVSDSDKKTEDQSCAVEDAVHAPSLIEEEDAMNPSGWFKMKEPEKGDDVPKGEAHKVEAPQGKADKDAVHAPSLIEEEDAMNPSGWFKKKAFCTVPKIDKKTATFIGDPPCKSRGSVEPGITCTVEARLEPGKAQDDYVCTSPGRCECDDDDDAECWFANNAAACSAKRGPSLECQHCSSTRGNTRQRKYLEKYCVCQECKVCEKHSARNANDCEHVEKRASNVTGTVASTKDGKEFWICEKKLCPS